jgi:N-acetylneuraminate synthase
MNTFIIGEAGVNHNGSIELAKELIDVAVFAGADAVKFQTFRASELLVPDAPKAPYQNKTVGIEKTQFNMIQELELSEQDHFVLHQYCKSKNIQFLSTPFDLISLEFLIKKLNLKIIKISSGDLTNAPFLLEVARRAEKVILSTGMSTLSEVEAALGVLAYGFLGWTRQPGVASFIDAFSCQEGLLVLRERVTLLHCTTEYPAPCSEVNLAAVQTMASAFGLPVGYSDHTTGIHIPIAAVARGSVLIEKHFTMDRRLPGPDHQASIEPNEFRDMISMIRDIEMAIGDGIKRPTDSEIANRSVARKSLVCAKNIMCGENFSLACKRPALGVSPYEFWNLSAKNATRDYIENEAVDG